MGSELFCKLIPTAQLAGTTFASVVCKANGQTVTSAETGYETPPSPSFFESVTLAVAIVGGTPKKFNAALNVPLPLSTNRALTHWLPQYMPIGVLSGIP